MILRRIIAACALLCALVSGAHAQTGRVLTPTQLNAEIFMLFGDNTTGAITPFALRQVQLDLVASLSITATAAPLTVNADTNITATLSGTPATALLQSVGINFGWLGQLAVPRGGTGQAAFTANLPLIGNGTGAIGQGTRTGNTTKYATSTGTLTSGDCIVIDASGNLVDNGSPCGAGSNTAATQNFVAGVGFTAGTTTSLTLSSSPTNANELLVAFDGAVQSHDTWSLAGAVITFSVAIPQNVNVVEAQWTTASTTAGVGSLTDSAGNVATGPVNIASPLAILSNTITTGGACFVQSRTSGALLNLSLCNVVMTGGYTTSGDGGGGMFKNIGSAPFTDSFPTAITINQPGSGCTNGSYVGYPQGSSTGTGMQVEFTVSGGVVTAASYGATPGNAYVVGDVLSLTNILTCGNQPNLQIISVSAALGSFTDLAGNHWQLLVDQNGVKAAQFGAKPDWTAVKTDSGSTINTAMLQAAGWFAYANNGTVGATTGSFGAGGVVGGKVLLAAGSYATCAITIPEGVWFAGAGQYTTMFKVCDGMPNTSNFITLCDPNTHVTCAGTRMTDMNLFPGTSTALSNIAMIYTNNDQQSSAIERVTVAAATRACLFEDTGWGGAALISVTNFECAPTFVSSNPGIILGYTAAITTFRDTIIEAGGSSFSPPGMLLLGGAVNIIDGGNSEGMINPIEVNIPTGQNNLTNVSNWSGFTGCAALLFVTNTATGQTRASMLQPGGCTHTVNDHGTPHNGILTAEQFY